MLDFKMRVTDPDRNYNDRSYKLQYGSSYPEIIGNTHVTIKKYNTEHKKNLGYKREKVNLDRVVELFFHRFRIPDHLCEINNPDQHKKHNGKVNKNGCRSFQERKYSLPGLTAYLLNSQGKTGHAENDSEKGNMKIPQS